MRGGGDAKEFVINWGERAWLDKLETQNGTARTHGLAREHLSVTRVSPTAHAHAGDTYHQQKRWVRGCVGGTYRTARTASSFRPGQNRERGPQRNPVL
jgi:hypothetical protein